MPGQATTSAASHLVRASGQPTSAAANGLGRSLVSHEVRGVCDPSDRIVVLENAQLTGAARASEVTQDDVVEMIALDNSPPARAEAGA